MGERFKGSERRQGVRLSRVLPAKFMLIDEEKSIEITQVQSGFVRNISAGGALLETSSLNESLIAGLLKGMTKVALEIEIPDTQNLVRTLARAIWFNKVDKDEQEKEDIYILGLKFIDITTASQDFIKDYIIRTYLG